MKIDLPHYHWFVNRHEGRFVTNIYTGSAGTQSGAGSVSTRTFHYKVYADISSGNENEFRMIAESYVRQPWQSGGTKTDFERAEFPCVEDCVSHAARWLSDVSAKHGF